MWLLLVVLISEYYLELGLNLINSQVYFMIFFFQIWKFILRLIQETVSKSFKFKSHENLDVLLGEIFELFKRLVDEKLAVVAVQYLFRNIFQVSNLVENICMITQTCSHLLSIFKVAVLKEMFKFLS